MSAPETNVKTQKRRHRPVLYLMGAAAAAVLVVIVGIYAFGADEVVDEAASGEIIEAE